MRNLLFFCLFVLILVFYVSVYATPISDINFLLATISQDSHHNTILSGYIDLDELPSKLKKQVVSMGYKPGDLVPAKCMLSSRQSKKGIISILVPPAKDLASKNRKDWKKLGSFHPILFDTLEKWKKRNEASSEIKDPNAIETHIAALKDNSQAVRSRAIVALGKLNDPRAIGLLIGALNDVNRFVRDDATNVLGRIKDPRAVEQLIAALKDTNSVRVRSGAASALGRIKDPRAVEPLIAALKDDNYSVRQKSAWALGNIKDLRSVEPLIAALKDDDSGVRRNAVNALGEIKDPRSIELLIAALQDTNWKSQSSVKSTLDKIDPNWANTEAAKQSVFDFVAALKDTNSATIRKSAATALGYLKNPHAAEPLIDAMKDEDRYVRMNVISALGNIGDTSAVKPLIAELEAPNNKNWASHAMGKIKDPRAEEPLIATLKDTNSVFVRSSAAEALGKIKDPRAVEPLIAALNDKYSDVRTNALKALRQITGRGLLKYDSWIKWWDENKESFMKNL